jgi:glycosyltransferase involved in cell wall biosynthesis
MSSALIYPSYFEGFGIPVLEALWSRVPVITSYTSCLPEAGGPGSLYIDPANSNDIAEAMKKLMTDHQLREKMISEGWDYAQNFSLQKCSDAIMKVYKKTLQHE